MEKKTKGTTKPPIFEDYDAVVFHMTDGMCSVSPYNTETGEWLMGMNLLTSLEEVVKWEVIMIPESLALKNI